MRYNFPTRCWKTFVCFVKDFVPPRPSGGFWNFVGVVLLWLLVLNPAFWILNFISRGTFMVHEWIQNLGPEPSPLLDEPYVMPASWLLSRVTVEEAERAHSDYPDRPWIDGLPFGFCNAHWCGVKAVMQEDDELWEFTSSPETWESLYGSAGYAVIRDGKVVAQMVTVEN